MANYVAKPELGLLEAVKCALKKLFVFSGRSRRSEFWWFILVFFVFKFIVNQLVQLWSIKADSVIECILMLIPLALTVRRLHDTNKGGWWVYLSYVLGCVVQLMAVFTPVYDIILRMSKTSNPDKIVKYVQDPLFQSYTAISVLWVIVCLVVIVFCCLDSNEQANKYGESPKYCLEAEEPAQE